MNSKLRILAALALAGTAATAPVAAGTAVNTMGDPVYFAKYQNITLVGGLGSSEEASSFDNNSGTIGVSSVIGPLWNSLPALQQAVVTNDGATYWARASGPTLSSPPTIDTLTGAFSSVNIYQSFTKTSEEARLSFTYTGGLMQSFRHPEFLPPCGLCTFAALQWEVTVWLNGQPDTPVMRETGYASLFANDGIFQFDSSQSALDGSPVNPLWTWDCARCNLPAVGLAEARLQAPFTGIVDLSAIPFDAQQAQQPEFTVGFRLLATADVSSHRVGATAWARDPLDLGNDAGVGLTVLDLQPTNNPVGVVPEPASALLLAAGLWALLARARSSQTKTHRRDGTAPRPVGPGKRVPSNTILRGG
jgi:hypothetical protein